MSPERLAEVEKQFTQHLRSVGMNGSRQRIAVLHAFLRQETPVSAQELHYPVKKEDVTVSFTTVYHTLKLLVACGLAREILSVNHPAKYELAIAGQCSHSHMVCQDCGASISGIESAARK